MKRSANSRPRRSERGVTLLMVAISIAVLLAIAALAVDLGVLYTARTSAQHAVDAAALAGATTFAENVPLASQPAAAANAVKGILKANSVMGNQVNLDAVSTIDDSGNGCAANVGTPPFICVDTTNQRVTVAAGGVTATSVEVYFAKIFGLSSVGVAAMATAEAGKGATGTYCLKPLYMPLNGDWSDSKCKGSIFDSSTPPKLLASEVGAPVTLWVKKMGAYNVPSQDGLLSITENPGGAGVRDGLSGMSSCAGTLYKCGDSLALDKPGNNNGPVTQGVTALITQNGTQAPDTWPNPGPSTVGQYCHAGDCRDKRDTSPSLVTVAVWDCTVPVDSGRGDVTVAGFAQVFIDSVSGSPSNNDGTSGGISAHLVSASSCGAGGPGGGGGTSTGAVGAVPVRLIQTPTAQ
jgi:Flp pilus assembly protein TadG